MCTTDALTRKTINKKASSMLKANTMAKVQDTLFMLENSDF